MTPHLTLPGWQSTSCISISYKIGDCNPNTLVSHALVLATYISLAA